MVLRSKWKVTTNLWKQSCTNHCIRSLLGCRWCCWNSWSTIWNWHMCLARSCTSPTHSRGPMYRTTPRPVLIPNYRKENIKFTQWLRICQQHRSVFMNCGRQRNKTPCYNTSVHWSFKGDHHRGRRYTGLSKVSFMRKKDSSMLENDS